LRFHQKKKETFRHRERIVKEKSQKPKGGSEKGRNDQLSPVGKDVQGLVKGTRPCIMVSS